MSEYKCNSIYSQIQRAIHYRYDKNMNLSCKYVYEWESDFITFTKSDYTIEFEIKLSRSDFFADFKKYRKHRALQNPCKLISYPRWRVCSEHHNQIEIIKIPCPNRFYYFCPEGLIKENEVPKYAGLVYLGGKGCIYANGFNEIKKAPLLHKEKFDNWKYMAYKLYNPYNHDYLKSETT